MVSEANGTPPEGGGEEQPTRLIGPAEQEGNAIIQQFNENLSIVRPGQPPANPMNVVLALLHVVIKSLDRIELHAARRAGELQVVEQPQPDEESG